MSAKTLLIVGVLGLSSLAFAGTKSYNIVLQSPTKAGANELKPGEYKLRVEGSQAVFSKDGKEWTVPVKVETNARKFDETTIESSATAGDMDTIHAIDLAGSTTKLEIEQ
jgi:hypothetical protein